MIRSSKPDDQNYRVNIKLSTTDIFDVESRLIEINQLRSWLDELTEWQPEEYSMTFHASGSRVIVWFRNQDDALMCKLRWG